MPRKVFKDGPVAKKDDITEVIKGWDSEEALRATALSKQRLLQDRQGKSDVSICLPNAARNHHVLFHVAKNMATRKRLSADPVEVIMLMLHGWYTKNKAAYESLEGFDAKSWAFKDGWTLHKLLTLFRPKAMRDEHPRDLWMYTDHVSILLHYLTLGALRAYT